MKMWSQPYRTRSAFHPQTTWSCLGSGRSPAPYGKDRSSSASVAPPRPRSSRCWRRRTRAGLSGPIPQQTRQPPAWTPRCCTSCCDPDRVNKTWGSDGWRRSWRTLKRIHTAATYWGGHFSVRCVEAVLFKTVSQQINTRWSNFWSYTAQLHRSGKTWKLRRGRAGRSGDALKGGTKLCADTLVSRKVVTRSCNWISTSIAKKKWKWVPGSRRDKTARDWQFTDWAVFCKQKSCW